MGDFDWAKGVRVTVGKTGVGVSVAASSPVLSNKTAVPAFIYGLHCCFFAHLFFNLIR